MKSYKYKIYYISNFLGGAATSTIDSGTSESVKQDKSINVKNEFFQTEKKYLKNIELLSNILKLFFKNYESGFFNSLNNDSELIQNIINILSKIITTTRKNLLNIDICKSVSNNFIKENVIVNYINYKMKFNSIKKIIEKKKYKKYFEGNKFKNIIKNELNVDEFNLDSLIIQPIQRVPRYRLLIEEYIKNLKNSKEYCEETLEELKNALELINNSIIIH